MPPSSKAMTVQALAARILATLVTWSSAITEATLSDRMKWTSKFYGKEQQSAITCIPSSLVGTTTSACTENLPKSMAEKTDKRYASVFPEPVYNYSLQP